jgi:hypothetical protein
MFGVLPAMAPMSRPVISARLIGVHLFAVLEHFLLAKSKY